MACPSRTTNDCSAARPVAHPSVETGQTAGVGHNDRTRRLAQLGQDEFAAAGPLVVRHDAVRHAAWGLQELVRPRANSGGRGISFDAWSELVYRFAGGGIEIREVEQWFTDPATGKPTVRSAKLAEVKWQPTGHPVERLVRASAAGPAAVAVG